MSWLWKSIGLSDEFVVHIDDARLAFHQVLALWIGLVLLIPTAYFIWTRQQRNLRTVPFTPRLILTTIRVLVLLMLVIVLAGPYLKLSQQRQKKPILAVLLDHSQSMELEAGPFEPESELVRMAKAAGYRLSEDQVDPETRTALTQISRAKLAHSVLQAQAEKLLAPLAKKYELQFYSVAQDTVPLNVKAGKLKLPEPPLPRQKWGSETHLGDAISHVLREAAGRQVAGIIVFTDGQNTAGRSLAEVSRDAAAAGTPIFAIPTGSSRRKRDVAIADVFAANIVAKGDTAHVAVTVESQGFDGRTVKVELVEDKKVLDTKELVLRSSEQQRVDLTFRADKEGPHFLTVQIPKQNEESEKLSGNNTDSAFVRVVKDKLRVLYLEGLPRWDFRFLKNAMRRDPGLGGAGKNEHPDLVLEAEWRLMQPAQQEKLKLPKTLEALAEYHTVILGDVSPELVTPEFMDLLVKAVRDKGVGLIIEAGPLHMPHEFDKRLLQILPVRLARKDGSLVGGWSSPDYQPFQLQPSAQGSVHEAMRFYDDPGRNQNAWRYMPPYYWCAAATRPAPAATVLAWNPSLKPGRYGKRPLIAHHFAGKGRVMFVGTDSTWLWRQNVGDRYFYKFWGQAIRFVARRREADQKQSWMEVRPLRAQPGEKASIELMAFTDKGLPRTDRTRTVQVSNGKDKIDVSLTADAAVKGRYTGSFPLEKVGEYQVEYRGGSGTTPVRSKVRVMASTEELRHPNVDRAALQRLGDISGGQMVELPDLGEIPPKLKGEPKISSWSHEKDIWDNWLVLGLLVILYSLDVGMRRLAGLS